MNAHAHVKTISTSLPDTIQAGPFRTTAGFRVDIVILFTAQRQMHESAAKTCEQAKTSQAFHRTARATTYCFRTSDQQKRHRLAFKVLLEDAGSFPNGICQRGVDWKYRRKSVRTQGSPPAPKSCLTSSRIALDLERDG